MSDQDRTIPERLAAHMCSGDGIPIGLLKEKHDRLVQLILDVEDDEQRLGWRTW